MSRWVFAIALFLASPAFGDAQDCTVTYVGRDAAHATGVEPSVDIPRKVGFTKRENDVYGSTNVFRIYLIGTNSDLIADGTGNIMDVFEFDCSEQE